MGFTCRLVQCDRFAAAAVLAFNNQMAHVAHSCTPEYPAFLFVVLIVALGQAVFHPVRPGLFIHLSQLIECQL